MWWTDESLWPIQIKIEDPMPRGPKRRSAGCAACRARRVKCDEHQPLCLRCSAAGRECVYPPRYQFVDQSTRFEVPDDWHGSRALVDQSHLAPITGFNLMDEKPNGDCLAQKFQLLRRSSPRDSRSPSGRATPIPRGPSRSGVEELTQKLTDALQVQSLGYRLEHFGKYMFDIPTRLGHNPALDASVTCLLRAYSQLLGTPSLPGNVAKADEDYLHALRMLQRAIEHPTMGMSSETVCATVLMAHYEILVPEKSGRRFLTHAGGAEKLIRLRGPGAVCTDLDRDIIRSQRGRIVLQALVQRQGCFLLEDGWKDIDLRKSNGFPSIMLDRLLQLFSQIPYLSQMDTSQAVEYSIFLTRELAHISETALGHKEHGNELVFTRLAAQPGDLFSHTLRFHDVDAAMFHTWRWAAFLLLASREPGAVAGDDSLLSGTDSAVQHICMSYDYALSFKPLGAQFLQLPLIVAYNFAGQNVKDWMVDKLNVLVDAFCISYTSAYVETMAALIMGGLKQRVSDI